MLKIEEITDTFDVYDISVQDNHNFYANDILVHNCTEVNLYTSPSYSEFDGKSVKRYIYVKSESEQEFKEWLKENDIYIKGQSFGTLNEEIHECTGRNDFFVSTSLLECSGFFENYVRLESDVELVYGDKPAEIALCTLAAINLGKIKQLSDLQRVCRNIVDTLEWIIDEQEYPLPAAEKMLKRRNIGIGVTNFAYWLVKNNLSFENPNTLSEVDKLFEYISFYITKASNELAKEKGKCKWYNKSNFAKDKLLIDTYNKNIDKLVKRELECDWETLRENIKQYGMRNTALQCYMPVESCVATETKIETVIPFFEVKTNLSDLTFEHNTDVELTNDDTKSSQNLVPGDFILVDNKQQTVKTVNIIRQNTQIFTIGDILKQQDICLQKLKSQEPQWIKFKTPIYVNTLNGIFEVNKIWYNGITKVNRILFQDNYVYRMTDNHKLLGFDNEWIKTQTMCVGDRIKKKDGTYTIVKEIDFHYEITQTFDLEVPEVHHYFLDNGVVSHNSSVVNNSTNGLERPRTPIQVKTSKAGANKMVIPGYSKYKNKYQYAFDSTNNIDLINIYNVIQKWTDQGISCNLYYDPKKFENSKIPMDMIANEILQFYSYGGKQLYYSNTLDNKSDKQDISENLNQPDSTDNENSDSCSGGACTL